MRRLLLTWLLLLAAATSAAQAQFSQSMMVGGAVGGVTYTGPLDISGTLFTAWYALRAGSAAIAAGGTQKIITARNTVTNETCDILVSTNGHGGLGNTANCSGSTGSVTPSSFCTQSGGTNCAITKWYDQTGNGHDMIQATTANQPTLLLTGGPSGLPTAQFSGTQIILSSNFSPNANRLSSFSTVGENAVPNQEADLITSNGNNGLFTNNTSSGGTWWLSTSGSGTIVGAASNAFHAGNGAINTNGQTSFIYIDATETTSTAITGNLATAPIDMSAGQPTTPSSTVNICEGSFADGVAWTTTIALNVQANQKAYWGTP